MGREIDTHVMVKTLRRAFQGHGLHLRFTRLVGFIAGIQWQSHYN